MANPSRAVVVAGNYRSGTTWLAEMLTRGLGEEYELLFEPIRAYYAPFASYREPSELVRWRPCIDQGGPATVEHRAFASIFDGSIANLNRDIAHTDLAKVREAPALVVKMVRGLCSLPWMHRQFEPRYTFVLIRNPVDAIDSQLRRNALPGTPQHHRELRSFFEQHPEVKPFIPRSGVEWLATYWAMGYYAALKGLPRKGPGAHTWALVRYEDLLPSPSGYDGIWAVFAMLGEHLDDKLIAELATRPSVQTKRATDSMSGSMGVWAPARSRVITRGQEEEVWHTVARFPGLINHYQEDAP